MFGKIVGKKPLGQFEDIIHPTELLTTWEILDNINAKILLGKVYFVSITN